MDLTTGVVAHMIAEMDSGYIKQEDLRQLNEAGLLMRADSEKLFLLSQYGNAWAIACLRHADICLIEKL